MRVIYSEPETWKPSEAEYVETVKRIKKYESRIALSSIGVCNITRTPLLASVVMQNAPTLLIAFTSSNEQVLNALFNDVVPSSALLINAKSKREPWREKAAIQINHRVINDFHICKSAISSFELLDYISVFNYLAEVYRKNCYNKRIVVSPTGGKIHTLSCAIFKACCQDVHVEYPTPESYHFDDYSSDAVHAIYEVRFPNFGHLLEEIAHAYHLDG